MGIGRTVLLADYSEKALDVAAEQLRGEGHDMATHTVDVSQHEAVVQLADAAVALGPVTQVVHTAGVSPGQATTERILHVDLLGTALVHDDFARIMAPGGAGVVTSSMAGHMAGAYPYDTEHALASTLVSKLLALPFLAPEEAGNSGAVYALSKRGNAAACEPLPSREATVRSRAT
ncbi:SDR family NAD(P)-dependent oxidoreductase [Streptomyces mirabilis]